jgi:hypothetical protein
MELKTIILNGNKLDSTWSDSTIPLTENTILDKLFVESSRFKHLSDRLVLLNVDLNIVGYSTITVQRKYESNSKNFKKILNAIEPFLNSSLDRILLKKKLGL